MNFGGIPVALMVMHEATAVAAKDGETAHSKLTFLNKEPHMNESTTKGKWTEIKGEIQKAWGDLTGDEIEKTQGNVKSLTGVIQQRYGHKEEDISTKLSDIFSKYAEKANDKIDEIKTRLKN